jgi:hypothetical protein
MAPFMGKRKGTKDEINKKNLKKIGKYVHDLVTYL